MTNFRTAAAFLLFLPNSVGAQENCAAIEELGTPNLDRYDFSTSLDVDDNCQFTFKISFKHDESLPIPTNPMAQCSPAIVPPEISTDGLPYFAGRWAYQTVPDDVKTVTGIDHISIDFNPCGHPPLEVFGTPHYDLHIYLETPEFRTCMTCIPPPGAPICDPTPGAQTTPTGLGFFNVAMDEGSTAIGRSFDPVSQPKNMPRDFVVAMDAMVPLMGGHAWDPMKEPASSSEWVDPIWIMGPYDGGIVDYEPMIPLAFMVGETDHKFMEKFSYEGQTIDELPSSYYVEYDASTKMVLVTLIGSSAPGSCEKKVEEHSDEDHSHHMDEDKEEDVEDSGSVGVFHSLAFSIVSIVMASILLL